MSENREDLIAWHREAAPLISTLMKAEDQVLSRAEGPAVALTGSCDQLITACRTGDEWLTHHPCPDTEFGANFESLLSSCLGIWSILSRGPQSIQNTQRGDVHDFLFIRITRSTQARIYLRQNART